VKLIRVGLIVEDQSDYEVIHSILDKIAARPFAVTRYLGHGCGKVIAKCGAWARQLRDQGCTLLIVVCDLDTRHLTELKGQLETSLTPCPFQLHIIVIPVREIEAWLLADHQAITQAMKLRKAAKKQANPEAIMRPKEHLGRLIFERSEKRTQYLNTVHNKQIAAAARITQLRRCQSFRPLHQFAEQNLT